VICCGRLWIRWIKREESIFFGGETVRCRIWFVEGGNKRASGGGLQPATCSTWNNEWLALVRLRRGVQLVFAKAMSHQGRSLRIMFHVEHYPSPSIEIIMLARWPRLAISILELQRTPTGQAR
jgi:hypothetical protein